MCHNCLHLHDQQQVIVVFYLMCQCAMLCDLYFCITISIIRCDINTATDSNFVFINNPESLCNKAHQLLSRKLLTAEFLSFHFTLLLTRFHLRGLIFTITTAHKVSLTSKGPRRHFIVILRSCFSL